MKFRSERDSLVEALTTAGRAVGGRGASSAVLSGLLLQCVGNRLTATGTDLDLTIRVEQEVIGLEDGSCVVPARLTADIVRSLEPGAVTLEGGEEKVDITASRSHFGLRAFPAVEFPSVSQAVDGAVELPAQMLAEGLRQVVRAASNDDARPLLTGVLMTNRDGEVRLVATDSYRLALRDLNGTKGAGPESDVLVPARAWPSCSACRPLPPVTGTRHPAWRWQWGRTRSPLCGCSADQHASARRHVPRLSAAHSGSLSEPPSSGEGIFSRCVAPGAAAGRDNTTPVRLAMRQGGVDLSVVSQEVGDASETVDGDFTGDDLVIAFNPSYLIDGVEAVVGDEVVVETADASRPATVRGAEDDQYRYLLMPVRVS